MEHRAEVRAYIERRMARQHVDDLLQETWARALAGEARRDDNLPALPWLMTIARNVCIDSMRRERRIDLVALGSDDEPTVDDEGAAALVAVGRRSLIAEVFAGMPVRWRHALVRH